MGYGDEIIATAIAKRNFDSFKKKTAFGRQNKLVLSKWSDEIFKYNPKIVRPGEPLEDVIWDSHCIGSRCYSISSGGRFQWNSKFKLLPGEFFFSEEEELLGKQNAGYIILEPNSKNAYGNNRKWDFQKFQEIANLYPNCAQFDYGQPILKNVVPLKTKSIREAAAILKYTKLLISLHGGMQLAAGSVGCNAIILFGEFVSPEILGFDFHTNLFTGSGLGCGSQSACDGCRKAMNNISVEDVTKHINEKT